MDRVAKLAVVAVLTLLLVFMSITLPVCAPETRLDTLTTWRETPRPSDI